MISLGLPAAGCSLPCLFRLRRVDNCGPMFASTRRNRTNALHTFPVFCLRSLLGKRADRGGASESILPCPLSVMRWDAPRLPQRITPSLAPFDPQVFFFRLSLRRGPGLFWAEALSLGQLSPERLLDLLSRLWVAGPAPPASLLPGRFPTCCTMCRVSTSQSDSKATSRKGTGRFLFHVAIQVAT